MLGRLLGLAGAAVMTFAATGAQAQYKNSSFSLDGGYWLITKPSTFENETILPTDRRPLRLANGFRIGGETDFKMDEDHWWFIARVNVAFLQYSAPDNPREGDKQAAYDVSAKKALGTIFGVQGQMGLRYYIMTDRFRPYLGMSLSYLRLMTFSNLAEETCTANESNECAGEDPGTNEANFLPHPNVGGLHLEPGAEIILSRDIFLRLYLDLQHWLVFNAADNNAVVLGLGITFYT